MRTIIDIPDEQRDQLADYCARERISRAEAVRRAISLLIVEQRDAKEELNAALDETFGIWKDRGLDTDEYLDQLRAEWDR